MQLSKKLTLLAAGLSTLAPAAFAETGVTFYGRANVSVENQSVGGKSDNVLVDNASRVGLRASRDLPDGMSAGMVLEAGTNLTSGSTNSKLFAREATAALNGGFGQVKLGRLPASAAYFATADYISNHNHDTGTSSDALYEFLATGSLSNAIGYASPKMGGMDFQAQYGLKKGTGTGDSITNTINPVALAANYETGPLALGLGYERAENPNAATKSASQLALRAFYTLGSFGMGAYIQKSSGDKFDRSAYRLSGMYTLGQNEFHLNYGAAGDRDGKANTGATQMTFAYNYKLDKNTKVYALVTQVSNESQAKYGNGTSTAATLGQDPRSVGVGFRYNF